MHVYFRVGAFVFIVSVYAIWSLFKHFDERKRAMKRHRFVNSRHNKTHWSSSRLDKTLLVADPKKKPKFWQFEKLFFRSYRDKREQILTITKNKDLRQSFVGKLPPNLHQVWIQNARDIYFAATC